MESTADALVIGAGIMGLTLARELRQRGVQVTILERDLPGRQASWAGAGELSEGYAFPTADPRARLSRFSCQLYGKLIQQLDDETGLDSGYRREGHLVPAVNEAQIAGQEQSAIRLRSEGVETEIVRGQDLRAIEPALGPRVLAALLLPGTNLDNRQLVRALELAERRQGTRILSGIVATEILTEGDRVVGVRTLKGDFHSPLVVIAAGAWSPQLWPTLPVVPQRGQILAVRGDDIGLRRAVLALGDPYLLPRLDGRLIIGATREFVGWENTLTVGGVARLLQAAMEIVPALAGAPIVEMWTGFRPHSLDQLPIIGEGSVRGLYAATGHGAAGLTQAPGTAALLTALICGDAPPIPPDPYSPLRFIPQPTT